MKFHKRILCLDFDGVIHSYSSGWKGARVISDPIVPGALVFMATMLVSGWDVAIHSSRSGQWGGRRAMRNWLKEQSGQMWYDTPAGSGLERVRFPLFKPAATVTIDDRAITFEGFWPTEMELRAFKPWNKK
jgi:hypothetical protein